MDLATVFGIIIGAVFIILSLIIDGNLIDYWSASSVMIVIGGMFASTLASYSVQEFLNSYKVLKIALRKHNYDLSSTISRILELATMARREGLLSLDKVAENIEEPFLKKGIMLVVDGTDPELVKNIMETELIFMEQRHQKGQAIFLSMSEYAPAYGMIGTLIGLINMLKNLNDNGTLGIGMATALITTFYGIILANLVLTPIAGKLKQNGESEISYNELILEGLLSIQAGENPKIVEEKLTSFVAKSIKSDRAGFIKKRGENFAETQGTTT